MINVIIGVAGVGIVAGLIAIYYSVHNRITELPTYRSLEVIFKARQADLDLIRTLQKSVAELDLKVTGLVEVYKQILKWQENHDKPKPPAKIERPRHRKYKK